MSLLQNIEFYSVFSIKSLPSSHLFLFFISAQHQNNCHTFNPIKANILSAPIPIEILHKSTVGNPFEPLSHNQKESTTTYFE